MDVLESKENDPIAGHSKTFYFYKNAYKKCVDEEKFDSLKSKSLKE